MSDYRFELDPRDRTPQWISAEYLVQVTPDNGVVAFAQPNEDFDDYDEIDLEHENDPVLIDMVEAACHYRTEEQQ